MVLVSGLVTAVDDQEQAAASFSNATPALPPPTIDCHRKQPDGRLGHRNRPFVLVGAIGWICPHSGHCSGSIDPPEAGILSFARATLIEYDRR
jgi:hypothetical protein